MKKYIITKEKPLKVLSLFSGIGAFEKGLKKKGIPFKLINFCEIDKFAAKGYALIHNVSPNLNLGDINKVNPEDIKDNCDLLVFGSPCQDFSVAGYMKGAEWKCSDCGYSYNPLDVHYSIRHKCPKCANENIIKTRSSLICEGLRIIRGKQPNIIIYENVKSLVSKKFINLFNKFIAELNDYGYDTKYEVLNAKDFGIPQNRERIFVVATKKNLNIDYSFPDKIPLLKCLRDVLEPVVDEKFYLSEDKIKNFRPYKSKNKLPCGTIQTQKNVFKQHKEIYAQDKIIGCLLASDYKEPKLILEGSLGFYSHDSLNRIYNIQGLSPTLTTMAGGDCQPKVLIKVGEIEDIKFKANSRVYSDMGIAPTLLSRSDCKIAETQNDILLDYARIPLKFLNRNGTQFNGDYAFCIDTSNTGGVMEIYKSGKFRIRRLTPKECFVLMGFDSKDHDLIESNKISMSQRYKMAGNSIVVNVLENIYNNLFQIGG